MKKMFLSLAVLVALSTTTVFASGADDDKQKAVATLKKEFAGADQVTWTKLDNQALYQANFILNDQRFQAYFDEEGSLVATGRFINGENLPIMVSKSIRQKYGQYAITEAYELVRDGETSYVVSISNEGRKIMLQAYDNGSTTIIKKEKKD